MQVLKEEIRQSILENAEKLFLEKGYQNTSMREIASLVNVSVSNLYKYFPDKFSLYQQFVVPFYKLFPERMDHFLEEENEGNYTEDNIRYVSQNLYEKISIFKTPFLLLMDNPDVPEFGDFKESLYDKMTAHIVSGTNQNSGYEPFIIRIIVKNIWDGLFEIFKYSKDSTSGADRVYHLIKYHFMGLSLFHDTE